MNLLVIGCGNPDRGDDAAGVMVARRLQALGIEAVEHGGEGLGLMERWRHAGDVILVDALVTGGEIGTVSVWDAQTAPVDLGAFRCSTHTFGLAHAIKLAKVLGRLPRRIRICGIEAAQFEPGTSLSPAVAGGVERAARQIAEEVAACTNR